MVPGDIIEITANLEIPADAILLSGSCIVDDRTLTGSSSSVVKSALPTTEIDSMTHCSQLPENSILKAGSKCEATRAPLNTSILALVVMTGFNTEKGIVLRNTMLPSKEKFQFFEEALRLVWVSVAVWLLSSIAYFYLMQTVETKIILSQKDIFMKTLSLAFNCNSRVTFVDNSNSLCQLNYCFEKILCYIHIL